MTKDLSRMNRARIKRDKIMIDSKGVKRYVPFNQWKSEVVNNHTGVTATRAKRNKDPDLKKLSIDVIGIKHGSSRQDTKVTPSKMPKLKMRKDHRLLTLRGEVARRMGFRSAEEGKGSKQKVKVKNENKKNKE